MKRHFRHFNAAVCVDAADAWIAHLDGGGKMFLTLAGAMSTAGTGHLRGGTDPAGQGAWHLLYRGQFRGRHLQSGRPFALRACAGLPVAFCRRRSQSARARLEPRHRYLHSPKTRPFRKIEEHMLALWRKADRAGESYFPYQFFYQLLESRGDPKRLRD